MQAQSKTLVRKQFFISPTQIEKIEKLSSESKGHSVAQIVRDAIDAYNPIGNQAQITEQEELLAIAHTRVKEAIAQTEATIKKVDHCLENLSGAKGIK